MSTKSSSRRRSRRKTRLISSGQDWDRRHLPGRQLHESEKLLVGALSLLVIYLPWALGSTHVLAQSIALCIAVLCFGAAILPRQGDTHSITSKGQFRRVFSFPVFWFGLLFLGYLTIQGFNSSHLVEGTEEFRYLTEKEPISWLPSGLAAPFAESNPFRSMLIAAIPFFAICAAWVGLTRRKSVHLLLTILSVNGLMIAAIVFYKIAKGQGKILWFYEPPTSSFLGPFLHHWQGAGYLVIVMAAAVGMAAQHFARARRSFHRSNPSGLFTFVGLALMLISIFSASRLSATLCGGLMGGFLAHIIYRELSADALFSRRAFLVVSGTVLTIIGMVVIGKVSANYTDQQALNRKVTAPIASYEEWSASNSLALSLFQEKPVLGWGGGSFRHLHKEHANDGDGEELAARSLEAEYAASDWFRMLAEFGIVGSLLLLLPFLYLLKQFFRKQAFENPLAGFLLAGVACGLVLCLASPLLQNAAFVTTWLLLLTFGGVLVRVETAAKSRSEMED